MELGKVPLRSASLLVARKLWLPCPNRKPSAMPLWFLGGSLSVSLALLLIEWFCGNWAYWRWHFCLGWSPSSLLIFIWLTFFPDKEGKPLYYNNPMWPGIIYLWVSKLLSMSHIQNILKWQWAHFNSLSTPILLFSNFMVVWLWNTSSMLYIWYKGK